MPRAQCASKTVMLTLASVIRYVIFISVCKMQETLFFIQINLCLPLKLNNRENILPVQSWDTRIIWVEVLQVFLNLNVGVISISLSFCSIQYHFHIIQLIFQYSYRYSLRQVLWAWYLRQNYIFYNSSSCRFVFTFCQTDNGERIHFLSVEPIQ